MIQPWATEKEEYIFMNYDQIFTKYLLYKYSYTQIWTKSGYNTFFSYLKLLEFLRSFHIFPGDIKGFYHIHKACKTSIGINPIPRFTIFQATLIAFDTSRAETYKKEFEKWEFPFKSGKKYGLQEREVMKFFYLNAKIFKSWNLRRYLLL